MFYIPKVCVFRQEIQGKSQFFKIEVFGNQQKCLLIKTSECESNKIHIVYGCFHYDKSIKVLAKAVTA